MKCDFKSFLKVYDYSCKSYSLKYGLNLRTVENWSYRGVPENVFRLIMELEKVSRERDDLLKRIESQFLN